MKPMYQDEECTPSEGVSQSPADFKGKMVKIPTEKDKILELYPGKLPSLRSSSFGISGACPCRPNECILALNSNLRK